MHFLILACLAVAAVARPSFIAIPADQIAFLDLNRLQHVRVPRQALEPPPPPQHIPYHHVPQQGQHLGPELQFTGENQQLLRPKPHQQLIPQTIFSDAIKESSGKVERPLDFGEYVDFGAHTGDHGAFGWYADYPVSQIDISSY